MENETLQLLEPVPEERLQAWLSEFYGKPVKVADRQLLRHRDLSRVERLTIADGLPQSLIYKQVLPPWDIEQDLHERVLIPSLSNSAQLFMSAHYGDITAMFLEDLGTHSLQNEGTAELASQIGQELAKMHRAYSYRTDELVSVGVLPTLFPIDYEEISDRLCQKLSGWGLIDGKQWREVKTLSNIMASRLAGEPISLVHGDLYAENLIIHQQRLFIIDWSWFTLLGVPIMDLATLTLDHVKNGKFVQWRDLIIESYSFESGRQTDDVRVLLPAAEALSRLLFLRWLVERRGRGILGTTVGPVDDLIPKVVQELQDRLKQLRA